MRRRRREPDLGMVALVFFLIVCVLGAALWFRQVESSCHEMGGHVKWLHNGKGETTDYLCLSPDGRILG